MLTLCNSESVVPTGVYVNTHPRSGLAAGDFHLQWSHLAAERHSRYMCPFNAGGRDDAAETLLAVVTTVLVPDSLYWMRCPVRTGQLDDTTRPLPHGLFSLGGGGQIGCLAAISRGMVLHS
jgi:hypothetical protein